MAIISIRVSDDTFQKYAAHDGNSPQRAMERQLQRYEDFSPTDRTVLLSSANRKRLEKLFGQPIESQDDFVRWIEKLASLKVGEWDFPVSPGQIKRLEGNASFFNESPEDFGKRELRTAIDRALGGAF